MNKQEKIKKAYIDFIQENSHRPDSSEFFTEKSKIKETVFYEYYNSFEKLEQAIWLSFFDETIEKIEADEIYYAYSVREKLLAFYYTLIEVLKENRGFVQFTLKSLKESPLKPTAVLVDFKKSFNNYISNLLSEGVESQEVISRKFISDKYPEVFWGQMLLVLYFWKKDETEGFEKTDTLIEKAVNTSFDIIGSTLIDTVLDFAKFLIQNR